MILGARVTGHHAGQRRGPGPVSEVPGSLLMLEMHSFACDPHIGLHFLCVWSVVSDSLRPQGVQPTRLLYPWDSPGESTVEGCRVLHPGALTDSGIEPGSPSPPALAGRVFTTKPPGKPKAALTLALSFSLQMPVTLS